MNSGESSYRRFCAGDDNGMIELVRQYSDPLMLYLNNYVDDIHIAEDLMQETFIRLAVKKPRFDEEKSSFRTWLYFIGRNIAIDYLRKMSRRKTVSLEDHPDVADRDITADVENGLITDERNRALYTAIKALKQEYRQVLYLAYFESFGNGEIAVVMHKSRRQIENLLYNAKKALRNELERQGFVYEEL